MIQHNSKLISKLKEYQPLIQKNIKEIEQLKADLKDVLPGVLDTVMAKFELFIYSHSLVVMLMRKQCDNPEDFFDKTFRDYQEGFSANGELQLDQVYSA